VRTDFGPVISVEAQLWQKERDRAVAIANLCLRHKLEERKVQLAEDAGRELANMVRALVRRLVVQDHPELWVIVREEIGRMSVLDVPAVGDRKMAV
jgi:hypothetical protein